MAKTALPKTWEEVAKIHGIDPKKLPNLEGIPEKDHKYMIAVFKMPYIVKAINGQKFKADFSDWSQYKWYPWFSWNKGRSAFVFVLSDCVGSGARAGCGPRFAFESEKKSDHAAEYFFDVFMDIIMD